MTELEILAELKTAYLQIEDIIDNQYKQITENEECELRVAMGILAESYENIFKRIEKENEKILYYEKNIMIANQIYHDYVTKSKDYDDQYICYDDTEKKTKWWEDYQFQTK